jgi:DNA gyrase subunit A
VNKAVLVERIADVVLGRKLPAARRRQGRLDRRRADRAELKRDADPKMVMAYLFKHTPLQTNVPVNLTCLIPTENPEVGRPERLELKAILWHFLHFRLEVVTARLEHELAALRGASTSSRASRRSSTRSTRSSASSASRTARQDAAAKIMKRFELDAEQTDAILELKIYRLARLEILVIQNELADKRKRARGRSAGC